MEENNVNRDDDDDTVIGNVSQTNNNNGVATTTTTTTNTRTALTEEAESTSTPSTVFTDDDRDPFSDQLQMEQLDTSVEQIVIQYSSLRRMTVKKLLSHIDKFSHIIETQFPKTLFDELLQQTLFFYQLDGMRSLLPIAVKTFEHRELILQCHEKLTDEFLLELAHNLNNVEYVKPEENHRDHWNNKRTTMMNDENDNGDGDGDMRAQQHNNEEEEEEEDDDNQNNDDNEQDINDPMDMFDDDEDDEDDEDYRDEDQDVQIEIVDDEDIITQHLYQEQQPLTTSTTTSPPIENRFLMFGSRHLWGCFDKLTSIDLSGCTLITDYSLMLISNGCMGGALKRLFLNNCGKVTGELNNVCISLPRSLIALSLEDCDGFCSEDFENLTQLQYLNITKTEIPVDSITKLTQLKTLIASANLLTDDDIAIICDCLKNLECLDISVNSITYRSLDHLTQLSKLKKLNVSGCRVGFESAIEKLSTMGQLQQLALLATDSDQNTMRDAIERYVMNRRRGDVGDRYNTPQLRVYYSREVIHLVQALDQFTVFDDYCGSSGSSSDVAASSIFASQVYHMIFNDIHQVPVDVLRECLAITVRLLRQMNWSPNIAMICTCCISSIITSDGLDADLVRHEVAKTFIQLMIQITQCSHRRTYLALYVLFSTCNIALGKENRLILDQLEGTKLVYEIMNLHRSEHAVMEYGCHCIANMNWPSTDLSGESCRKIVQLIVSILQDQGTNEALICSCLNALRNLTCDVQEVTEEVAEKSSLTTFSNLIEVNYEQICSRQREIAVMQRQNNIATAIQATQDLLNQSREILFGLCSLLWNLSENDRIRLIIFENCFETLSKVAFSTEFFDIDIAYFVAMTFSNLISNKSVQEQYMKQCNSAAKLLQDLLEKLVPSRKIKTEWGSFDPLFCLLNYDENAGPSVKYIITQVGAWSLYVFANLSFRRSYQKRLISEGGIPYLIRAIRTKVPEYRELVEVAVRNISANKNLQTLIHGNLREQWQILLSELRFIIVPWL